MTKNQIEYMKLQEDKRYHDAQVAEMQRSNQAREAQDRVRDLNNLYLGERTAQEKERANKVGEYLNLKVNEFKYGEEKRHNEANEAENRRHNVMSEVVGQSTASAAQTSAGAAYLSAQAAQLNAQTRADELAQRIVLDTANIDLGQQKIDLSSRELAETIRHNTTGEGISMGLNDIRQYEAVTGRINAETNQQKVDIEQQNATSNRIGAIAKAVDSGNRVANTLINVIGSRGKSNVPITYTPSLYDYYY